MPSQSHFVACAMTELPLLGRPFPVRRAAAAVGPHDRSERFELGIAAVTVPLIGQAIAADGEPVEGAETQPAPPRTFSEIFFEDYQGSAVIAAVVFIAILALVLKVQRRAREISRYGEGLDRHVRVQVKKYEDAGRFGQAGDVLFSHEDYEEAADLYEKAEDWIRAGEAWDRVGNTAKAASFFKRAGAPGMAGDAYARKKQHAAAAREYVAADAIDKAAESFAKAKDFSKAAELFIQCDRLREAGESYDRIGDKAAAADCFEREFSRQFDMARGDLKAIREACELAARAAEYIADAGRVTEAAELLYRAGFKRRAAELYTDIGEVDRAATIYIDAGRPMHAAKLYESVGDSVKALRNRAEARLLDGDKAGAAEDFAKAGDYIRAAEIYNEDRELRLAAEMYEKAGDIRTAADLYRHSGEPILAAQAYEKAGDFGSAMELYHEAGDYKAELQAAKAGNDFFRVGSILLEHGRKEDALAAFQRMDVHDHHYEEAAVIQGDILRELDRLDVAFQKYRTAVGDNPASKANVDIIYKMAKVAEDAGVQAQALQLYESVIGVDYYYKDAAERAGRLRSDLTSAGAVRPALGGMSMVVPSAGVSSYADPSQIATGLARSVSPSTGTGSGSSAVKGGGRYEVLDEIARGGMGIVYKARDTVLDRVVAYKVLSANLKSNRVAVKYFLREAKAAAKMSHPNIVTVFDAGEQGGEYYMAMEYVEGQTLKSLVSRQGAFPEKLVRYIIVHACRGLQYAHDRGLVHRDIKPGNMMLTRDRALKIMDFGLAKFLEEAQASHTRAIGTPYYMSPEQILGKDLDGRTDIYSLGVSMFECATGQVPFAKGDLSYHHLNTEPPRVSDVNPNISKELSDVIYRCMSKDADERYATATELMAVVK